MSALLATDVRADRTTCPFSSVTPGHDAHCASRSPRPHCIDAQFAAEVFEQPHQRLHERVRAALGEKHTPFAFQSVNQRIDRRRGERIPADEQRVIAEELGAGADRGRNASTMLYTER